MVRWKLCIFRAVSQAKYSFYMPLFHSVYLSPCGQTCIKMDYFSEDDIFFTQTSFLNVSCDTDSALNARMYLLSDDDLSL